MGQSARGSPGGATLRAEDERELVTWQVRALEQGGFQVDWLDDGRLVRRRLKAMRYDALVLGLGVAAFGSLVGTIVGMLPGLGPIKGVAMLMPLAFALKLPPETALILLSAVYLGCEFGGRILTILLNVPGDAGAIMTAIDGNPMARNGMAGVTLSISAWSSSVGTMVAFVGIVFFAPLLARWALAFGPAECFALM